MAAKHQWSRGCSRLMALVSYKGCGKSFSQVVAIDWCLSRLLITCRKLSSQYMLDQ